LVLVVLVGVEHQPGYDWTLSLSVSSGHAGWRTPAEKEDRRLGRRAVPQDDEVRDAFERVPWFRVRACLLKKAGLDPRRDKNE
jgi:hypothetical protein